MKSDGYGAQGAVANETEQGGETSHLDRQLAGCGAYEPAAAARHGKRVLVADPDDTARRMLVNLVESLGYEAVAARGVEEALELARALMPEAALIDIGAPMLDGLSAARHMRELAGQSALLLIALTGWGQPQYRDMALAAGFDVHLVKPVGVDQLGFLLSLTLV
ncbi:response regulator [Trinickia dabaoshanensis]|uniref:Response regulator n=1 Tax=Trinickia dabaoshanensis TaxID=564714 RepID=A0A2N7VD13_9BURK|nr:response regulator [Trinickia dabaoshanensis]PMS15017.1 response regulator [Trinickia dabaoshanensis]